MYNAKVLLDSIAVRDGKATRLTTMEVTLPRIVLAEFNTHRTFSRNSASSRAIPVKKRIESVRENPFIPEAFGKNQKGMQASENLSEELDSESREIWMYACTSALVYAKKLDELGVHKQLANRLIEPFSWHTIIVSATEWDNFFALRCNKDAQPEIRKAAELMREAMAASRPEFKNPGEWHLPLIDNEQDADLGLLEKIKVSCARCARVSYLTHDGRRDVQADIDLYDRLLTSGHMSPMEHAAMVNVEDKHSVLSIQPAFVGNFRYPFIQHRKMIVGEATFNGKD